MYRGFLLLLVLAVAIPARAVSQSDTTAPAGVQSDTAVPALCSMLSGPQSPTAT